MEFAFEGQKAIVCINSKRLEGLGDFTNTTQTATFDVTCSIWSHH